MKMKILSPEIRVLLALLLSVISSAYGGQNAAPALGGASAGTADAACTSQKLIWIQNGRTCSTTSGTATSGQLVNLRDTTGPTTGTASFTCSNGIWGAPSPPLSCSASAIPIGAKVTDIKIVNTGTTTQTNVPVTFGQVFAQGDMLSGDSLAGNIGGNVIPLQVDVKATHADGSLRHAIISAFIPSLTASQTLTMDLVKTTAPAATSSITPADLLAAGFTASVNISIGGVAYTASADSLLAGSYNQWLAGSVANEWQVSAPLHLVASPYTAHPALSVRFYVRAYGTTSARVDVVLENDTIAWNTIKYAFLPLMQAYNYDINIVVGGNTVYPTTSIKHYTNSRWHKIFWWGTTPAVDVKLNIPYLIGSKAVPNYDQTIPPLSSAIAAMATSWNNLSSKLNATVYQAGTSLNDPNIANGPLGIGILEPYMPYPGGRQDIAPLPGWAVLYLLSMDTQAKMVTLGLADSAGAWQIHYRDKNTDLPISMTTYPYIGGCGSGSSDCKNYTDGHVYALPYCATGQDCSTIFSPESAHEPSLDYLPYLVTGDYYYLEELEFWANWNLLRINPGYRSWDKAIIFDQVRGMAWDLRTLGQTAYILPDNHPMKSYFTTLLDNNITFLNNTYVIGNPNQLGIYDGSGADVSKGIHPFWPFLYSPVFVGYISGTNLTVTKVTAGSIYVGEVIDSQANYYTMTGFSSLVVNAPFTPNLVNAPVTGTGGLPLTGGGVQLTGLLSTNSSGTTATITVVTGGQYTGGHPPTGITGIGIGSGTWTTFTPIGNVPRMTQATVLSQTSGTTGSDGVYQISVSQNYGVPGNPPGMTGPATGVAPWQDDFLTWATGELVELGFTEATSLRNWKAKYPVGRMTSPACWIWSTDYLQLQKPAPSSALYTTPGQVYDASFAKLTGPSGDHLGDYSCNSPGMATFMSSLGGTTVQGEMAGYAYSAQGFPSNLQPALAIAVDSGITGAAAAWNTFINRTVKPVDGGGNYSYGTQPQFSIVPRY